MPIPGYATTRSTSFSFELHPLMMTDIEQPPQVWEVYKGNSSVLCEGRCISGKDRHLVRGVSILLIGVPAFLYGFSGPYLWNEVSPATVILVAYFQFLSLCNYLMTSYTDPGIAPRALKEEGELMYPLPPRQDNTYLPPPRVRDIEVNGQDVTIRYCFTCHHYKAPRVNHCGRTNDCIDKFDHYCPWTGQAIGARNYRFFIWFLASTVVLDILVLVWSVIHLEYLIRQRNSLAEALTFRPHLAIIIPLTFCVMISVGGLLVFHIYLMTKAFTTNETFKRLDNEPSPFQLTPTWKNYLIPLLGPRQPPLMRWRALATAYDLRIGAPPIAPPFNPVVVPDDDQAPPATVATTHPVSNPYTTYTRSDIPPPGNSPDGPANAAIATNNGHAPTALAQAMAGQPAPLQHDALAQLQAAALLNQSTRDSDGAQQTGRNSSLSLLPLAGDVVLHRSADQLDKVSVEKSSLPGSRRLGYASGRGSSLAVPSSYQADASDSSMRANGERTPAMRDTSDDDNSDNDDNDADRPLQIQLAQLPAAAMADGIKQVSLV